MKSYKKLKTYLLICIALLSTNLIAQNGGSKSAGQLNTPIGRHECSFVQAGDKFYLMGGRESDHVQEYNYTTKRWSLKAEAPVKIHHFQAVEYNGLIWIIAGLTGEFGSETPLDRVYMYDPAQNKWINGPEIPVNRRRGSTGVVEYQGSFYIIGGTTNGHFAGGQLWTDKWDPATNTWTTLANGPRKRDHFHAVIKGDKIYAVGGRHSGENENVFGSTHKEVDIYNISTNTWTTPPTRDFVDRAAAITGIIGNEIVVLGGEHTSNSVQTLKAAQAFNLSTNNWRNLTSLPNSGHAQGRHGTQGIVSNNVLWAAGGSPNKGGGNLTSQFGYYIQNSTAGNQPTGTAITKGEFIASNQTLTFNPVTSNQSKHFRITHSKGNQGIVINKIRVSGTGFSLIGNQKFPLYLAPGKSLDLLVNYTPTTNPTDGILIVTTAVPNLRNIYYGLLIDNSTAAENPIIEEGVYNIVGANNEFVGLQNTGNNVLMRGTGSEDTRNQWIFKHLGNNEYTIKNIESNNFLEVPFKRCGNNQNVATYSSVVGNHQKWIISRIGNNNFGLRPKHCPSHRLDKNNGHGENVVLKELNTSSLDQHFKINPVNAVVEEGIYNIVGLNNEFVNSGSNILTAPNGQKYYDVSMVNGMAEDTKNQWYFKILNGNEYTIKNIATDQFLDLPIGNCKNDQNVSTWETGVSDFQKWIITKNTDGTHLIRPKLCLSHVLDKSNGDGGNIKVFEFRANYANNQSFNLNPVNLPSGIIEDGTYTILGYNDQLVGALSNNVKMVSTAVSNTNNQWIFEHLGNNEYTLKNVGNSQFLQVENAVCDINGRDAQTSVQSDGDHRKWIISESTEGRYFLKPKHCPSRNLDKNGGSNGQVHIWTPVPGDLMNLNNRSFHINPVSSASGLIADGTYTILGKKILNDESQLLGTSGNDVVKGSVNVSNANNQWIFKHLGSNEYTVQNVGNTNYLQVDGAQCSGNGHDVGTGAAQTNANHQKWIISESTEGRYFLRPKHCPSKYLDKNNDNSPNVHIWGAVPGHAANLKNRSFHINPIPISVNTHPGSVGPIYTSVNVVAVASANLPDGRILAWSGVNIEQFGSADQPGKSGQTHTTIFDPINNSFTETLVTSTGHDMFCPGISTTGAGEIVVSGGANSEKTTIYNMANNTWTVGPQMQSRRGYHSTTILSNGKIFALGGSWSGTQGNKQAEIYSSESGWKHLANVSTDNTNIQGTGGTEHANGTIHGSTNNQYYRQDNHAWLFAAPGAKVFQAGPGTDMHWIETTGEGSVLDAGTRGDDAYSMTGISVMYDIGKILTFGGSPSYSANTAASNRTYKIDISDETNANVTKTSNMNEARTLANGVVLPNGEVVAIGGDSQARIFNDLTAKKSIEIWSPITETWRIGTSLTQFRTYHSSAILMKDGRIWTGGGGYHNSEANHPDAQIYSPPYLFNENGTLAERPSITNAPTTASYNSQIPITVNTNSTVSQMVLMRLGTSTHSTNTDQRRIPINFTKTGTNNYTAQIPNNDWAPPGYYFLFVLNSKGTPSIGKSILIGGEIASEQLILNGDYHITDLNRQQQLADFQENNNNVRMSNKDQSKTNQTWNFVHLGDNVYTIQNAETKKFLEIPLDEGNTVANAATRSAEDNDIQKWIVSYDNDNYFFRPVNYTSAALDRDGNLNGNVQANSFSTGNNNQKFNIIKAVQNKEDYSIVNGTFYIQNKGNGHNMFEHSNTSVVISTPASANNHKWEIEHMGNGKHAIRNISTNSLLVSKTNDCENNDGLATIPLTSSNNKGYYYIKKIGSAHFLVPEFCQSKAIGKTKRDNSPPQLSILDISNDNQQWNLIPIDVKDNHNDELQATPISGNQTELRWIVSQSDEEVLEYTVERTTTLFDFDVTRLVTIAANSKTGIVDYQFVDEQPEIGDNYYRIKIKYKDGNTGYIQYKMASFDPLPEDISISPNPASDFLNINLSKYMDETIYIMISSMNGNILLNKRIPEGHSAIETLNVSNYTSGTYIVHMRPEKHAEIVKRLIISKN